MVNFVRDNEMGGIMMIPLFHDWQVRRCNIKGCRNEPSTIVTQIEDVPIFGLCEEHYQEGKSQKGTVNLDLEWDDYDAFKAARVAKKKAAKVEAHKAEFRQILAARASRRG